MAQQFNLTAQINLQSPKNVGKVVSDIQRQLKGSGLNTVNIKVKADPRSMAQTNKQLQNVGKNSRAAAKDINTLNRSLKEATRRFSVITLATGTLLSFVTGLKNSTKAAIEFERELIKISQVTGKSVQQLQGLTKEVTRLSTAFGVSSADLLNVSRTLAQAGFSAEKTRKALDILAKTTLAATFDNIQDTTEGAIALLRQFGNEAKRSGGDIAFLEKSLSAINSVSKKFAVESGDLITVIRRVGGVFSSAGGSINELIALFTSVRATTRESAETIATGLRTIFTRIQRTDTIDQLKALNIQLQDSKGQFVGAFEAVKRLSQGLAALDPKDFRFSEIVESLGGFRQIGKVIPLIQQFAVAQEALSVAQSASGSVAKDAATAQQGLGVQIQKVKEEFTALIRQFSDSGPFNTIATGALKIASAMIKVAEAVEPLLPLLTTMFGLKLGRALAPGLGQLAGVGRRGGSGRGGGGFSRFARGGMVPGQGNRDTVPAMLTPGEFVIKKSSVKSLGTNTLAQMNNNRFNVGGEALRKEFKKGRPQLSNKTLGGEGVPGSIQLIDDVAGRALDSELGTYGGAFLRPIARKQKLQGFVDKKAIGAGVRNDPDFKQVLSFGAKVKGGAGKIKAALESQIKSVEGKSQTGQAGFVLRAGSLEKSKAEGLEDTILEGVESTVLKGANNISSTLTNRMSGASSGDVAKILKSANIDNVTGNIFEAILTSVGKKNPMADRDSSADWDYLTGLGGKLASYFSLEDVAAEPTDAKSSFTSDNVKTFIKKVKNLETKKSIAEANKALDPILGAIKREISGMTAADSRSIVSGPGSSTVATRGANQQVRKMAGLNKGGGISGSDTVPAMLTPGEFVFNKSASKSIGYGNLKRMNEQGVKGYAAGGVVSTGRNNYGIPAASAQISSGGSAADLIKDAEDEAEARKNSTEEIKKGTGETKKSSESVKKQTGSFSKLKGSVDKFRNNLSKSSERVRGMAGAAQSFVFIGASIGAVTSQMSGLEDSTKKAINETAGFAAGVVGIGATLVDTFYSMAASNAIQEQSSKRVTQANLEQAATGGGGDGGGDEIDEAAEGMGNFGKVMTGLAAGLAVGIAALQFFSAKNRAVADELQKDIKSSLDSIKNGATVNADAIKASAAEEIEARTLSGNQISYSALGTVAAFAAAGATVGTVFPVIGNVVGGIVGGLIGFGVAMFGASAATDAAIAARQKEIQAIYDTIDSIIALNQAQRDLETGIADIDAAKGLEPAEVVKKRLEVQKSGVGAGAEFQIAQGQLSELAKGTGKSAGQLTEADFEDDPVKLNKFNASSQAAASAMDVLNKRLQITSETFSLAMQNADPGTTFEELSTQAGPYKDALDAQIAAINERTQVEIFNAKQAFENAKGTANETAAKEALTKAEERGKTSIDNLRQGAEASHKILYAQAESARIARDASIALAKSLIENGKFFDGLNKQLQALQGEALAIDNFGAALDGAAFKFQSINIDEIDNLTNVRDLSTFAQQLGDAAKGAGPEAQKFVDQLTTNAKAFKNAQEGGLLGLEQKLTDDAGSGETEKILKDLGFNAESLGGGELGKVVFEKMQSELKKALEDGVVDASELEAILGPAEQANAQAVEAAKKLVEIRQQEIANLQKTIDVQNKLREKEIQAREAQVDAIRKGVGFTEKAYATLSKSIDPNADFTPQRGVETRLQNINAQNRLNTLGKGLQAGDIGGVTQARRNAQQRQEEIRNELGTANIDETKLLIAEQDKLRTIINTTGDELKRLSDRTSEAADIQGAMEQNLRAIEKERRAREQVTGVIEEFVIGGQDARKGLVEAAAGVRQAFSSGTLQMQSPEQRSATVGLLDKLSDTMVAGGMTGRQIKQELVFQDAVRLGLDPQLAEAIATGTSTEEKLIEANRNLAKKMEILSVSMLIAAQGLAPAIPFANGGMVQYRAGGGSIFKPRGTDTVPAMLSPGEFVIRKSAVDSIGADTLAAINEGGVAYRNEGSEDKEKKYNPARRGQGKVNKKDNTLRSVDIVGNTRFGKTAEEAIVGRGESPAEYYYNENLKKQADDPRSQFAGGVLGDPLIEGAAAAASNIGSGGAASLSLSGVDIGAGSTTTGGAEALNRTRNLDQEALNRAGVVLDELYGKVKGPLENIRGMADRFLYPENIKGREKIAQDSMDLSMAMRQGYKPSDDQGLTPKEYLDLQKENRAQARSTQASNSALKSKLFSAFTMQMIRAGQVNLDPSQISAAVAESGIQSGALDSELFLAGGVLDPVVVSGQYQKALEYMNKRYYDNIAAGEDSLGPSATPESVMADQSEPAKAAKGVISKGASFLADAFSDATVAAGPSMEGSTSEKKFAKQLEAYNKKFEGDLFEKSFNDLEDAAARGISGKIKSDKISLSGKTQSVVREEDRSASTSPGVSGDQKFVDSFFQNHPLDNRLGRQDVAKDLEELRKRGLLDRDYNANDIAMMGSGDYAAFKEELENQIKMKKDKKPATLPSTFQGQPIGSAIRGQIAGEEFIDPQTGLSEIDKQSLAAPAVMGMDNVAVGDASGIVSEPDKPLTAKQKAREILKRREQLQKDNTARIAAKEVASQKARKQNTKRVEQAQKAAAAKRIRDQKASEKARKAKEKESQKQRRANEKRVAAFKEAGLSGTTLMNELNKTTLQPFQLETKRADYEDRKAAREEEVRQKRGIVSRDQRGTPAQLARRQQEDFDLGLTDVKPDPNNPINKARYERLLRTSGPGIAKKFADRVGYKPPNSSFSRRRKSQQSGGSNTDQLLQQVLQQMLRQGGGNRGGITPRRAEGRAAGGGVSGADVIPAMLTPGEFVMSAGAVRQHGVGAMRSLNKGQVPGFNRGGMVGGVAYRTLGSKNAEVGSGSAFAIDTEGLEVFQQSFDKTVQGIASSLKGVSDKLGHFEMSHTFSGEVGLNVTGVDIDPKIIADQFSAAFTDMVKTEIEQAFDNRNKNVQTPGQG
jgi:TP901 family phage tail tape measure protein